MPSPMTRITLRTFGWGRHENRIRSPNERTYRKKLIHHPKTQEPVCKEKIVFSKASELSGLFDFTHKSDFVTLLMRNFFRKTLQFCVILCTLYVIQNCCSIVIPPVTLTGNKTAIEKQIIGEKNELEKDVWMVSSARTTTTVATNEQESDQQKEDKAIQNKHAKKAQEYMFTALNILETFSKDLSELKADEVVGEGSDGYLKILLDVDRDLSEKQAKKIHEKYNPEYEDDLEKGEAYRKLKEVVRQVNEARKLMIKSFAERQLAADSKTKINYKEIEQFQKQKILEAALRGEWIQTADGKWIRK